MNLYLISGLGADERIFEGLTFSEGFSVRYVRWLEPLNSKESLSGYCQRLSGQIDQREPFALIGLSFGGMVACALNRVVKPRKTILISSIAVRKELPLVYRMAGFLRLTRILPGKPPGFLRRALAWYMGVETARDKELLYKFIKEASPGFIRWAAHQAANWKCTMSPQGLYQLHGSRDRIFPLRRNNADYIIKDGGHFMVLNRARAVSDILKDILDDKARYSKDRGSF